MLVSGAYGDILHIQRGAKLLDLVDVLPREIDVGAPDMAVRSDLAVDRAAQVKGVDDGLGCCCCDCGQPR